MCKCVVGLPSLKFLSALEVTSSVPFFLIIVILGVNSGLLGFKLEKTAFSDKPIDNVIQ